MLFLILLPTTIVSAEDNGFVINDEGVLTKYNGSGGEINIPSNVRRIAEGVFYDCDNLISITIPDSVTEIGVSAFSFCWDLESIIVDKGNENYSDVNGVLYNKDKTMIIRYPRGKKDSSFVIPSSVTSIEDFSFHLCMNLTDVTIPASVMFVGYQAFWSSGITSLNMPNGLTNTGYESFNSCANLTSVTISSSITKIEDYSFGGCSNLTSITIPFNVTSIGDGAFIGCTNLTIFGMKDSYAETYAKLNNINFVVSNTMGGGGTVADPSSSKWIVNGVPQQFDAFLIEDQNYIKLRDLALALKDTLCQFDVEYADNIVNLVFGKSYEAIGSELAGGDSESKPYEVSNDILKVDGIERKITGYKIDGANYYKLRDLEEIIKGICSDFNVAYDEATKSVYITAPIKETDSPRENYPEFLMGEDNYKFANQNRNFTNDNKEYYPSLLKAYRELLTNVEANEWSKAFYGLCFGMSSTSVAFNQETLSPSDYQKNAITTYELNPPYDNNKGIIVNEKLLALIQFYQAVQYTSIMQNMLFPDSPNHNYVNLISTVKESNNQGVVIFLGNRESSKWRGHFVVAYDIIDNGDETYKIKVYDCNYPNDQNCYIAVDIRKWPFSCEYYIGGKLSLDYGTDSNGFSCCTLSDIERSIEGAREAAITNSGGYSEDFEIDSIIFAPLSASISNASGVDINDVPEAFQIPITGSDSSSFSTVDLQIWKVPRGEYKIALPDSSKNQSATIFDAVLAFEVELDGAAVVTAMLGEDGYMTVRSDSLVNFKMEYKTNETADNPLKLNGSGTNVTFLANSNDVTIDGDAKIISESDSQSNLLPTIVASIIVMGSISLFVLYIKKIRK